MSQKHVAGFLQLEHVSENVFVNSNPPWLPPGAQSIYGGTLVAHALVSAQLTVSENMIPRSIHCTFLLGGSPDALITYNVTRLSEAADNVVREVRALQDGKCLFIALLRFKPRIGSSEGNQECNPVNAWPELPDEEAITGGGLADECPFICSRVEMFRDPMGMATTRQWVRSRDQLASEQGGIEHIASLAYMSDNYMLPTASRVRNVLWTRDPELHKNGCIATDAGHASDIVGLMLTLSHSIHFHHSTDLRADEWIMTEMAASWIGDGRALVQSKLFKQDGSLIATAFQEGVFRLQQTRPNL